MDTNTSFNNSVFYRNKILEYSTTAKNINLERRGKQSKDIEKVYVIYLRRSTKGKDKQQRSIPDQKKYCLEYAKQHHLKWFTILEEKETAHKSDKREVFKNILNTIQEGKNYNSILAWHPDRLARNMKDAGLIIDMLDEGVIIDLQFASYTFVNDQGGKMALGIQFVLAKNYSDGISVNTKRGNNTTVTEGKSMGKIKHGYRIIDSRYRPDPKWFDVIQNAWYLLLDGQSLRDVGRYLSNSGYRDFQHTMLSRIFSDPFYAGIFIHGDNVIELNQIDRAFTPMITHKEFIDIRQSIDGRRTYTHTKQIKNILFKKMIICGYCNNFMTGAKSPSGGNREFYYYVDCKNENCPTKSMAFRKLRGNANGSPTNTRGKTILDFIINRLSTALDVSMDTYNKSIEEYRILRDEHIMNASSKIELLNSQIEDNQVTLSGLAQSLAQAKHVAINAIQVEIQKTSEKIDTFKTLLEQEEENKIILEQAKNSDMIIYDNFSNFFKNIEAELRKQTDVYLVDQLIRNVFLNLTVKDKSVVSYELKEPFKVYQGMGILHGVTSGT